MTSAVYSKLLCDVTYTGETLSGVPFVIDDAGVPFEPLNCFVREKLQDWSKKKGSVGQDVDRVLMFFRLLSDNKRAWDEATHYYVSLYVKQLEKIGRDPETINAHTSAVYSFYWRCEKRGYCVGLCGINDIEHDDYRYPLRVLHSRNPHRDYENPFLKRPKNKSLRADITRSQDWESAYTQALDADTLQGERDAALILLILESGARRVEALSLMVDSFSEKIRPQQEHVHVSVSTKLYESRILLIPVETYLAVQEFINGARTELVSDRRKDKGFVFCNRAGNALTKNHVSNRLRHIYNVCPKDGRSTFATNLMIKLYRDGRSLEDAMLFVRERMGHAPTDETARTLRAHYLQAKAIVEAQENGTALDQARKENANLKAQLSERDVEIAELKQKLRQFAPA